MALVFAARGTSTMSAWLCYGLLALLATGFAWRPLGRSSAPVGVDERPPAAGFDREAWRLIVCYGAFGFGYIIPATFLPSLARAVVSDPAVFGWTWPVFGLCAALSTLLSTTLWSKSSPRRLWVLSQLVLAVGVLLPALRSSLATLVTSAVCVGGTFVVVTMAGVRAARELQPHASHRLIGALTASFAIGQLLGPLTIGGGALLEAVRVPSFIAAATLAVSALALLPNKHRGAPHTIGVR
jgi:MFS family permease